MFLSWLLGGGTQLGMPGQGRTFRRKTSRFWEIWPMPPVVEERHRVVFVDGIYLTRKIVVLIACTEQHVLGWYLARSENSRAYRALMRRIAPPLLVVTDGGDGFEKARRAEWPDTKVQKTPRLWLLRRGFLTSSALCLLCGFFCLMLIFPVDDA